MELSAEHSVNLRITAVVISLIGALPSDAQVIAEHVGFVGAFQPAGMTSVSLSSGASQSSYLWGVRVGHRWAATSTVRLGLEIGLQSTNLRGMDAERDTYAFFLGDVGLEATARVHQRLRLLTHLRSGIRSAEYLEGSDVWNYTGSGRTVGVGFEVPLRPSGRGLIVEANHVQGTFTEKERLGWKGVINKTVRAYTLSIGWGGPMHISPFWE